MSTAKAFLQPHLELPEAVAQLRFYQAGPSIAYLRLGGCSDYVSHDTECSLKGRRYIGGGLGRLAALEQRLGVGYQVVPSIG